MRVKTSYHRAPFQNWSLSPKYRHGLNVAQLLELVKNSLSNTTFDVKDGKKRALSSSDEQRQDAGKRMKMSTKETGGTGHGEDNVVESCVPVYQHVFSLQYPAHATSEDSGECNDDSHPRETGWIQEEKDLLELLSREYDGITDPTRLDLGTVQLHRNTGGLCVFAKKEDVLVVPPTPDELDLDAHDFRIRNREHFFVACCALEEIGCVKLVSGLQMTVMPPNSWDSSQGELPFQLQLRITVSLLCPAIFQPVITSWRYKAAEAEEIRRHVLSYVYRPAPAVPELYRGSTDIPFFLSILNLAPAVQSKVAEEAAQPDALVPTLLPFQRRSLTWMLQREGKVIDNDGQIVPASLSGLPLFWDRIEPTSGADVWYFHRLNSTLSPELPDDDDPHGGILAEEPGLGKTVECIALILLNPAPERNPANTSWDPEAKLDVKEIKTTLIVTPASLASQWADELTRHAPSLKVLVYDGWSKLKTPITEKDAQEARQKARAGASQNEQSLKGKGRKRNTNKQQSGSDHEVDEMDVNDQPEDDILDWCRYVNTFDVCITTYNVLQQELSVARPPLVRPRRESALYSNIERSRSPLIMCEWYRVIMDEVQMVGGGKTEEMVSLIPRVVSWAVSGTPARAQVSDLAHVFKFLRVDAAISSPRIWNRLLQPGFVHEFMSLICRYTVRTTKSAVQTELTIPQQTRFLVSIELGRVERHVYDQTLEEALDELGLDIRGVAASSGWQIDGALLRSWIRKLRGICTHPQVGQLQAHRDKLNKPGTLKTMAEVLEGMRDQNWRNLMENRKLRVQLLSRRSQLQQHDETNERRYQHALDTLLLAEKEINQLVKDIKAAIVAHDAKGKLLKEEAATRKEAHDSSLSINPAAVDSTGAKGKGKALESDPSPDVSDEDDDLPHNAAGEEHVIKGRALQHRLRECFIDLHRINFLLGDLYHVLGASHSAAEDASYAAAERVRRNLLKNNEAGAVRAMAHLARDTADKGLTLESLLIPASYCDQGGIRSSDLMEEANEIIDELLNKQTKLLWNWRTRIYTLLTQKLSSGEDEATGQEYSQSLDTQGEAETYLQAYAALMADRRESLVAERTILNQDSAKQKKIRNTRTAREAAADDEFDVQEDLELQPEHEVLRKDLAEARVELRQRFQGKAIRSVMIRLNAVAARIIREDDPEKLIVKEASKKLRHLINAQATLMDRLEADLTLFRKAFNERILYFRQLQEISDSVAEVTWDDTVSDAIEGTQVKEAELVTQIATGRARQRYLEHLATAHTDNSGTMDEDEETCILCRCEFARGYITQCAHVFCEGCLKAWMSRKEGKVCPVCRVVIHPDQLQRFSIGGDFPQQPPPPKPRNGELAPSSRRDIQYNFIDPALFQDINQVESNGSYGSKIQTLLRHLLYLQDMDPGAKSIVFSAWADSLHIVQHALMSNGISCLRIDQSKGKQTAAKRFRDEPEILVLLLHGERENAGLNVTCASRVFMLESVVHHAFEIQAIARIDRMGQTRPTEVYCYYAEDTVERNILDLAARQGLSLYTRDNASGTLDVTPFAMNNEKTIDAPVKRKVQKGDFIFKIDDMLAILFPHMFEELEFLLPPENDDLVLEQGHSAQDSHRSFSSNAEAGPSRLAQ